MRHLSSRTKVIAKPDQLTVINQKENMSKSDEVLVASESGVTTLTMNRPEKLNAWTQSMRDALTDRMREAAVDDATKVAIITGRGKFYRDM